MFFVSRKTGFEQRAAFFWCQFQETSRTTEIVAVTLMTMWRRKFLWPRIKLDSMLCWGEIHRQWLFSQLFIITGGSSRPPADVIAYADAPDITRELMSSVLKGICGGHNHSLLLPQTYHKWHEISTFNNYECSNSQSNSNYVFLILEIK